MTEDIVSDITEALESGKELEGLVRDILRILEVVSGMESTYLTRFEDEHETLRLLFTHNAGEMLLPEGRAEPSGDTLCERSLQEGVRFAPDANLRWSDCPSIGRYDIVSYLSAPVLLSDGSVYGTLCAVSHESHELSGCADKLLTLFSRLISMQIEKETLLQALKDRNAQLEIACNTDALTGLSNRRAMLDQIPVLFEQAVKANQYVILAFVDLDGFKAINDQYGHHFGDLFLTAFSYRFRGALEASCLVGRAGGDEFIIATPASVHYEQTVNTARAMQETLNSRLSGVYSLNGVVLEYAGPSIGMVVVNPAEVSAEQAVVMADEAMYQEKCRRRNLSGFRGEQR